MKRCFTGNPLLAFFVLAFGFAWIFWVPVAVASALGDFRLPNPVYALSLSACAPTFAAIFVTAVIQGPTGIRALWRRVVAWRFSLRWYLFILVSPAALFLAGGFLRDLSRGAELNLAAAPAFSQPGLNPWLLLPVWLIGGLVLGPLNEEIGWRGFALPHLQRRLSPVAATLMLGSLWGVWHLPLFFIPGMSQAGQPVLPFLVSVACNAFFYTWLHNRTGGSILPAILLHVTFNTTSFYVPALPSEWWVIGVTAVAAAVVVVSEWKAWVESPTQAGSAAA